MIVIILCIFSAQDEGQHETVGASPLHVCGCCSSASLKTEATTRRAQRGNLSPESQSSSFNTLYSFLSYSGVVPTYLAQRITRTAIIQRVFVDQIPLLVNAHSAQSFAQKNMTRFVDAMGRPIPIAVRQAWPTCRLTMKASVIVSIPLY